MVNKVIPFDGFLNHSMVFNYGAGEKYACLQVDFEDGRPRLILQLRFDSFQKKRLQLLTEEEVSSSVKAFNTETLLRERIEPEKLSDN